ncbi:hypothetical protein WJX74_002354 [Apatococcus lobatus]|uniref:BHLH domain-containing protein n=1 Tax=Apatococcus lobatus TaxID=904363 RepID=A0AAW1RK73_9CHLO
MDGPIADFPIEQTFSEAELQDVLAFMEHHDPASASIPFMNTPNPGPVALQFQPHTYSAADSTTHLKPAAEPLSLVAEDIQDTRSISSDPSPLRESSSLEEPTARSDDADFVPPGVKQEHSASGTWDLRHKGGHQPLHAAMHHGGLHTSGSGGNLRKEHKSAQVSHSTVEKQRRDRINSLIDELRDLVPPQSPVALSADKDESKRPKHVVLSDTIALVKELRVKANGSGELPSAMPAPADAGRQNARELMLRSYPQRAPAGSLQHSSSAGAQELPLAPAKAASAIGVKVEGGPKGCLYVKVHCADRRGLLADIIAALKSMPLEITTAAVTTNAGYVHNVFQVHAESGGRLLPQDIQQRVNAALHGVGLADKRRRVMQ